MRITWVTRSFLDYRIPVYEELNKLCGNNLTVVYYSDVVPQRCDLKLKAIIGERAIGLTGEIRIGGKKIDNQAFANNSGSRITIRPGLFKLIRKTRPDIIISDGFFQWTYVALIIRALFHTPHIMCYERTLHTERNVSLIRSLARKAAAKFIDAICCNGTQTKEYLRTLGFPEDGLFLGNMAADSVGLQAALRKVNPDDIFQLRLQLNINGSVFLYSGQLISRKGIMELLSAWSKFSRYHDEATLIIVGEGHQKKEAETFILNNNIKSVLILGKVEYSDIHLFYGLADIFIIPTLEDNWSLVVPEAMSCSLPIICSKYNGCWPELVKPENGWVFDPLDEVSFASTLKGAWDSRANWKQMGAESLRIVQDYSPEKIVASIYDVCSRLHNK